MPSGPDAPTVRFETDYAGHATGTVTTARFAYAKGVLYVLYDIEGAGLNVNTGFPVATERKELYEEDCVELMMAPRPDEPWHFYEMQLGPFGHFYDLEIDRRAKVKEKPDWSSGSAWRRRT